MWLATTWGSLGILGLHTSLPGAMCPMYLSQGRDPKQTQAVPQPLLEVAVTKVSGGAVREEHCPSDSLTYVPVTFKAGSM